MAIKGVSAGQNPAVRAQQLNRAEDIKKGEVRQQAAALKSGVLNQAVASAAGDSLKSIQSSVEEIGMHLSDELESQDKSIRGRKWGGFERMSLQRVLKAWELTNGKNAAKDVAGQVKNLLSALSKGGDLPPGFSRQPHLQKMLILQAAMAQIRQQLNAPGLSSDQRQNLLSAQTELVAQMEALLGSDAGTALRAQLAAVEGSAGVALTSFERTSMSQIYAETVPTQATTIVIIAALRGQFGDNAFFRALRAYLRALGKELRRRGRRSAARHRLFELLSGLRDATQLVSVYEQATEFCEEMTVQGMVVKESKATVTQCLMELTTVQSSLEDLSDLSKHLCEEVPNLFCSFCTCMEKTVTNMSPRLWRNAEKQGELIALLRMGKKQRKEVIK